MTPQLYNELRHIDAELPEWASVREAWGMLRPWPGHRYLLASFWRILQDHLPYAKTPDRQNRMASWLKEQRRRAAKAGKQYPPAALVYGSKKESITI